MKAGDVVDVTISVGAVSTGDMQRWCKRFLQNPYPCHWRWE